MNDSVYSNAFNFGSYITGGVDARTGQYTASVLITQLRPPNLDGLNRDLKLAFSALDTQSHGFGIGWSLSTCTLDLTNNWNILTLSDGRSFRGNPLPPSGSDLSFKDQKLRDFRVRRVDTNTFDVIYKDGTVERLVRGGEQIARLAEVRFPTGETFLFQHGYLVNGVSYLTKVVFQQTNETYVEISYQSGSAYSIEYLVDHGKTARIQLGYQNQLLTSVTLPYDRTEAVDGQPRYVFSYLRLLDMYQVIETLRSPTGSFERVSYKADGHKVDSTRYIPYVLSHVLSPGAGQPDTTRNYSYSQDRNFLGYESGKPVFVQGEDNLYLVRTSYTYESTENIMQGASALSSTVRTFNKFHLMSREAKTQQGTRTTTTITYNDDPAKSFYEQPANVQKPRTVTTRYEDLTTSAWREESGTTETDDYGNTLSMSEPTGVVTRYEYYPAGGASGQCPADPFGFVRYPRLITENPAPGAAGAASPRTSEYTYLETATIQQQPAAYYVNKATERHNSGLSKTYAYYDQPSNPSILGLVREVRATLDQTTIVSFTYEVSGGATTATTATTGFDGVTTTSSTTLSRITTRCWRETDVNGVTTRYTYDVKGRLVDHTVSPDTGDAVTRRYDYVYPRPDQTNVWPVLVETDPQGVAKRLHYDGSGRVVSEEAQDDDRDLTGSGSYDGTFRLVVERLHDTLGQVASEKRYDWWWNAAQTARTTTPSIAEYRYEYDGWGRVRRTTFPDGHRELSIQDPITRTVTQGTEGEGVTVTELDAFEHPVTIRKRDRGGTEVAITRYQYDGFGRTVVQTDPLGNTTRYSYDAFDRLRERQLPDGSRVRLDYAAFSTNTLVTNVALDGTSLGTRTYDSLGRATLETVGGRTTRFRYAGSSGDKPSEITTARGDVLQLEYAPRLGGKLVRLTARDAQLGYQYAPKTAALLDVQGGGAQQQITYYASGIVRTSSDVAGGGPGTSSTSYAYSMAGLAQKLVDGFGQDHAREYDAIGRLQRCRQGTRQATLSYDAAGRPGTIRVEDTQAAVGLTTTLTYDDFSREVRRVITGRAEQVIETSYLANGQVARRVTTTGGQVWRDERYHYDALGRLDEYTCTGSQPPVDSTGRPVTAQRFLFDAWSNVTRLDTTYPDRQETTLFRYSAADPTQLTELERGGQTSTLSYDAAGNLTRDERGRQLEYDSQNRLVRVLEGGQVLSEYYYDALGKLVRQTTRDGDALRRYQGEIVSNQSIGDRVITYLGVEGEYFAQGEQGTGARSRLLATNREHSPVMSVDVAGGGGEDFAYMPYGERSASGSGDCLLGFHGESLDPVTGWYFLGNGYRVYNPTLLRFHSPDSWSPFGQGGLNPYLYGGSDPINWSDPTGHLSAGAWVSIGIGIAGILFGIFTLGAGAAISAGAIAGSGFIGAVAATSALSVTAATFGVASSAVGIASAALEENQQASAILGWVSLGLGVVSAAAGVAAIARSAASAASSTYASVNAAKAVKNEVAGVTESLVAQSLRVTRGEWIGLGVSTVSQTFGVVSLGTGIAGAIAAENGDDRAANVLNWVSRGFGIASLAANAGFAGQGSSGSAGSGSGSSASGSGSSAASPRASASKSATKPPPAGEASGSSVALLSVRTLGDQSVFRVSSDRINNAYQQLPVTAGSVCRRAELEVQSTFLTRL